MANVKISDLTAVSTPLDGTETLEIVQGGTSKKVTAANLTAMSYGSFCDVTDQTAVAATVTSVKFGTNIHTGYGISIVTDGAALTRITFTNAGTYMLEARLQFLNVNAADMDVTVFFSKNGTKIANSGAKVTVAKTSDGGFGTINLVWFETVTAGQYITLDWVTEHADVSLDTTAAAAGPPSIPAIPSSYVVVKQVA